MALAHVLGWDVSSTAGAQAAPARVELATVLAFTGSDKLLVRNEAGVIYLVQYIGVRGPVRSSILHDGASAFHGSIVIDQRVLLESDGKDEDQGYKLRHAYIEGNPVPLGAMALAAGWATSVPYPLEHRHRSYYLQIQEQAMAEQLNLWQAEVLGPAMPWRPIDSAESSYVAADPDLHHFLDLLYTVPTGQAVLNRLVRLAPAVLFRELPHGAGGYANPLGFQLVMSRKVGLADPRTMAAAIAHEGTHAVDFATGALDLTDFGCFEQEQRAHGIQAQVWAEFFGPGGKPDPQDDWDRATNDILRFAQRGDIENYVRRSPGYEIQCAGEGARD
jgi:hypothetical protein